jgi:predicted O-methyltransferase YrrM
MPLKSSRNLNEIFDLIFIDADKKIMKAIII